MLELLLESALRLLALGGIVWLILKLPRFRNPQVQMTAWTVVLLASLSMPALMRSVAVTIPAVPPPADLAKLVDEMHGGFGDRLGLLLNRLELDAMRARTEHLLTTGTLPEPDGDYHCYPWPMI